MDGWHIALLCTTVVFLGLSVFLLFLLKRMDVERARMENYLIEIGSTISNFKLRIESLFKESIHYYDETIYQFVESTKEVKTEIDAVMNEYDDLRGYIVPEPTPEELKEQQLQEQMEILGIVKPAIYPIRKI